MKKQQAIKHTPKLDRGRLTVSLFAIACITLLEAIALLKGIDGQVFALTLAAIAGISGYNLKAALKRR